MTTINTDTPSVVQHGTHYPGLDTLRAVAILMMMPRHAREVLTGDFFGDHLKKFSIKDGLVLISSSYSADF